MNISKPKVPLFPREKREGGANDNRLKAKLQHRAQHLRDWRIVNGLTLSALAKLCLVHVNTAAGWESGKPIQSENIDRLVCLGFPENIARLKIYGS